MNKPCECHACVERREWRELLELASATILDLACLDGGCDVYPCVTTDRKGCKYGALLVRISAALKEGR